MTADKIGCIAEIEKTCFSHPWTENSIAESFENVCNHFYIAECDGKVVGYIGFSVMADECYILNVAVLPQFRGQKIGERLVKTAIEYSINNKLEFITLEVRVSNEVAIKLYEKLGFEKAGERKNYYSNPLENALLLTKYFNEKNTY